MPVILPSIWWLQIGRKSNIFQEWMFLFQSFNFGSEKLPADIYVKKTFLVGWFRELRILLEIQSIQIVWNLLLRIRSIQIFYRFEVEIQWLEKCVPDVFKQPMIPMMETPMNPEELFRWQVFAWRAVGFE